MPVSSPFIVYINGSSTALDLRKVSSVVIPSDNPNIALVRFIDTPDNTVTLDNTGGAFLTLWQAALDASMGGGGGAVALGGDLGGTSTSGYVKIVRGLSSTMTYNIDGTLATVTTALGTKTFAYDGLGRLSSITGTGNYRSKVFTYDVVTGFLTGVTVS